jgi:HD-GYP domain-containing protein (c-di-GMP phosphodiesterase class II)
MLAGVAPLLAVSGAGVALSIQNLLALALPVSVAAVAYYAIETGLIATAISLAEGSSVISTWRERYRWLFSHYFVLCIMGLFLGTAYVAFGPLGLLVFTLPVLMMRYAHGQYIERTQDSVNELKRMNRELTRANREVVSASKVMQHLNEELFLTLSKIIDARDPFVSGHAAKVADYATAIARELGLPAERLEPLRQAGFLHDIGKIGISEQVLHKPDRLTDEEYRYVKGHAALGGQFLEMCRSLRHLAPFVRHHHEWWDGSGYPDGLGGEDIPLEARILAVCDAVEAMASDRPYRSGMSLTRIINEIKACSGTQFDPAVASAFVRIAELERDRLVTNSALEVLRKQSDERDRVATEEGAGKGDRVDGSPAPYPALPALAS